jgi:penicillin-binding protein 2
MRQGFREVVENEDGTAHAAFSGFNVPVAGKTGTAQVAGKGPTSLFASWFPADSPQYAVVAVVKEGGHGADTAAPIVRRVIDAIANPTNPFAGFPVVTGTTGRD